MQEALSQAQILWVSVRVDSSTAPSGTTLTTPAEIQRDAERPTPLSTHHEEERSSLLNWSYNNDRGVVLSRRTFSLFYNLGPNSLFTSFRARSEAATLLTVILRGNCALAGEDRFSAWTSHLSAPRISLSSGSKKISPRKGFWPVLCRHCSHSRANDSTGSDGLSGL